MITCVNLSVRKNTVIFHYGCSDFNKSFGLTFFWFLLLISQAVSAIFTVSFVYIWCLTLLVFE